MRDDNDKLSRLVIVSPCPASWDEMTGEGASRHCAQCDRPVHDLALLAPREIRRLVEAQRGNLCARITRRANGRIVTLPPPAASSFEVGRRVSPLAAALVAGLLGVPGSVVPVAAAPRPAAVTTESDPDTEPARAKPPEPAGASLFGRVTDEAGESIPGATVLARNNLDGSLRSTLSGPDGSYVFVELASGVYQVEGRLEGFDLSYHTDVILQPGEHRELLFRATFSDVSALGGAVVVEAAPLRDVFRTSTLVVVATIGASATVEEDSDQLRTELFVTAVIKGEAPAEVLSVERYGSLDPEIDDLPPGTEVLAFLDPGDEDLWRSADWHFGLKAFPPDLLAAYEERLSALAEIDQEPAELVEWLVETAENPLTREAAAPDLRRALGALEDLAREREITVEQAAGELREVVAQFRQEGGRIEDPPSAQLLAAFLTDAQRTRLTRALVATRGLTTPDLDLYGVVHSWAPERAEPWLVQQFRTESVAPEANYYAISLLGDVLGEGYAALVEEGFRAENDAQMADVAHRLRQALGRL